MRKPPGVDHVIDGRPEGNGKPIPLGMEFRYPVSNIMVEYGKTGNLCLVRIFFGLQILEVHNATNSIGKYAPPTAPGEPEPLGFILKTGELPGGWPAPPDPHPTESAATAFNEHLRGEKLIAVLVYPTCLVIDFRVACLIVFPDRIALAYTKPQPSTGETAPRC